ncbi:MAG: 2-dehydropantoate 2-reductase [Muribaculaceae bacterium]
MSDLKYAIVGCGAIGGFYGAKLVEAGCDVHFLFHSDYEKALSDGLKVDSVDGDIYLQHVNAYRNSSDMPKCDVVIVCLKTIKNKTIPQLIAPIVSASTTILLIQNGLGMERELAIHFPDNPIYGAMAFICSNKIGPAHIRHLDYGALTVGCFQYGNDTILNLADSLKSVDVNVDIVPDLNTARWRKLVWNIPFNGLSVVLNKTTDLIVGNDSTYELSRCIMFEVIEAARACGAEIPDSFADKMLDATKKMKPYQPSMMLDFLNQREMEIGYMYHKPVEEARAHGYEMKYTHMVECLLRSIQARYLRR